MNFPDNISHRKVAFEIEDGTKLYLHTVLRPIHSPCPKVLNIAVFTRRPPNTPCTREEEETALFSLFHTFHRARVESGKPADATPDHEWFGVLELLSCKSTEDVIVMRFRANGKGVSCPLICPP